MIDVGAMFMLYAYSKGDISDLTDAQRKRVRQLVEEIKAEYKP
jgi:hypothetical protein